MALSMAKKATEWGNAAVSSITSGSLTFTSGSIFYCIALNYQSGGSPATPTVSGGPTWVQVATQVETVNNKLRVTVFRAIGGGETSTVVIDCGSSQTIIAGGIDEATGADTTGTNGSGSVVQSSGAVGNDATPTGTLAAFGDSTNNAAWMVMGEVNENSYTPESGYTTLSTKPQNGIKFQSEWKLGQDTSVTFTAGSDRWITIAMEVKAAASGPAALTPSSAGVATVSETLNARRDNRPSSTGVATVSASIAARRVITITAAGLSTVAASIKALRAIAANVAGAATATVQVFARRAILATALGLATVSVSLGRIAGAAPIAPAVAGTSTASVSLTARRAITAQADGTSTVSVSPNARRAITVSLAGTATVATTLSSGTATTTTITGKYKPEHDSALIDVRNATGFSPDHGDALQTIRDAGV